ncbi:MAG: FAD-dependent oxidoreductase [Candidatus Bathyarchaeota archaeon]|nr:FAD-dependent oxidoreductase [Candidatus Bathyarchaeota archaeon]
MAKNILIIGGVATGPKTAARLRRLEPDAEITIVERGDLLSYAGCGMPFYIEDIIKEYEELLGGVTIRDASFFKRNKNVTVYDMTEALKINREDKTVTVKDLRNDETRDLPYDKLVLGTGARPFVPRMEGTDLKGVHRLYTPHDAKAIKMAVDAGAKKVAVVGGGLIGIETCGAFVARGCEVTVLEMMPYIVPALLDEEMALLLEKYLEDKGVTIVKGSAVSRIIGDGSGKVAGVETGDGRRVDADIVIIAIGVRPNTELAVDAGLDIGPSRAIAVNEYMQTSDPDIYAGGDCVECTHLVSGEKVFVPLGSTANKHGRIIADNIHGMGTRFPGVLGTAVFKILGHNCGTTGLTERKARELGYDVVTTVAPRYDYSSYIPGAKYTVIKLVADRESCRLLGCQVVGEGDGIKRIDVAATAITFGSNLKAVADLDLGYAPPYSTAIDGIGHAANVLRNKIQGNAHGISAMELKAKLDSDEDFVLLDIRRENECEACTFRDERTVNIPVDELEARVDEIPSGKEIVTICIIGVRAYNAERILRGLGFDDVKFLDGCLVAWPFPEYLTAMF